MVHQQGDHHDIPAHSRTHRVGHWLPADHRIHHEWLRRHVEHVDSHPQQPLIPVLKEFQDMIETNPRLYMYFSAMWDEVPRGRECYRRDPTGERLIRDYRHMILVLNRVFGHAPQWTDAAAHVGMVGVPLAAVFDYVMGTPSGHAAFLDPEVNAMLKKVLNEWGRYLQTPESAEVLADHETGWFGEVGYKDLMEVANMASDTSVTAFEEAYVCDPKAKHHGFKSWDDFFTRRVRDSFRPVASPGDDSVVANACESQPFNIERDIKLRDRFWIKGQPYSVVDMLAYSPLADQFAGGTVYQAFLSALSYHRWHAPVSGTVRSAFVAEGTYFSEPLLEHESADGEIDVQIQDKGIAGAQGYLTALATRAVIFFEADNPAIGLIAFIGVGMDEVSTCEITVKEGQRVKKGDEIGMFHFGGSSHVVMFRPGVRVEEFPDVQRGRNVPVRGKLCVVRS
ncbi:Phophatidylserine decarboxylase-domain-containing protein [Echria macrotheca]|uniref:Phophatidylserine decarboxylase-domain-containing protein n=1 Tax=Echria macrotheca TaxID=438768 RepID=A0AAJ0F9E3_9PEZI|nr:Phophatidylserine decarboxylase-domain-containing protein [Echria macrotheca]